jgi:hypothetical protein
LRFIKFLSIRVPRLDGSGGVVGQRYSTTALETKISRIAAK